ncbi:expressed unknown protein [Seminavis robusta]|uniref:Band 7 domain-containing protein n=1 Tax=Seminavis robusta TaxID=568900 RepID=A0A9N8DSP6_9STRA|nr:expressed unknown protein [Seminavis robusta]|eukprot:Sro260_g101640.1 n/a (566) ;mRNA; r:62832-64849
MSAKTAPLPLEQAPNNVDKPKSTSAVGQGEDTPAYAVVQAHGLLDTSYRKESFDEIFESYDLEPNSSLANDFYKRMLWGVYWTPGCGYMSYAAFNTEVTVPPGGICRFIDGENRYLFAKPGIHNITDPFLQKVGAPVLLGTPAGDARRNRADPTNVLVHGNRTIVIVPQGKLGYAVERGQPVLLPPGLHSWTNAALQYEALYDLDNRVIEIGPYTILTVNEGYAAITQNNGSQVILDGGATHLLNHAKWKFEKFITKKIQTSDLKEIETISADNIIMSVSSTVVWQIQDVKVAATRAAETMAAAGQDSISADITKLRSDLLKQAVASLAAFIGSVNYSDSFHHAAAAKRRMESKEESGLPAGDADEPESEMRDEAQTNKRSENNPMFDTERMAATVAQANQVTSKFGVQILSINVISANPVDSQLTASLASGAVASAKALESETKARGEAKAMKVAAEAEAVTRKITADSEAIATMVRAKAEGDAERIRAEGSKAAEILRAQGSRQAAELLQSSEVAVQLERLKMSSAAIKPSDKFFFGQEPAYMSNVVMRGPGSPMLDCIEEAT